MSLKYDNRLAELIQGCISGKYSEEEDTDAANEIEECLPGFLTEGTKGLLGASKEDTLKRIKDFRSGLRVLVAGENVEITYPFSEKENNEGEST